MTGLRILITLGIRIQLFFFFVYPIFWRSGVCWPFLCLCRPFSIFWDVWIQTQRAVLTSRHAINLATHIPDLTLHSMRICIQLFTVMLIRILIHIKVMRICDHWFTEPPWLHFEPPRLHCERPWLHFEPLKFMNSTLLRIQICFSL